MSATPLSFLLSSDNRTTREWSSAGPSSAIANARNHAKRHGAAGIWRANDSFLLFFRDAGKIRQKTWAKASPVN